MTQGAVSQQVAALEKQLDVALFHRVGRAVELSQDGRQLYDYARRIVDLVDEAQSAVSKKSVAVSGTLRIASSTVPAETVLPELLTEFRKKFPDVCESVSVSDTAQATQAVEDGEADVGLVGELPRSSTLQSRVIGKDELVLVVAPHHRLAGKPAVSFNELRSEPLIVREPGSASRRCVEEALEAKGISFSDLTIAVEVNSNDAIRAAVERGIGVGFLSTSAIAHDVAEGKIAAVKVRGMKLPRKLYAITDKSRITASPLREFLEFLDQRKSP